jgi:hypothetical protein
MKQMLDDQKHYNIAFKKSLIYVDLLHVNELSIL